MRGHSAVFLRRRVWRPWVAMSHNILAQHHGRKTLKQHCRSYWAPNNRSGMAGLMATMPRTGPLKMPVRLQPTVCVHHHPSAWGSGSTGGGAPDDHMASLLRQTKLVHMCGYSQALVRKSSPSRSPDLALRQSCSRHETMWHLPQVCRHPVQDPRPCSCELMESRQKRLLVGRKMTKCPEAVVSPSNERHNCSCSTPGIPHGRRPQVERMQHQRRR